MTEPITPTEPTTCAICLELVADADRFEESCHHIFHAPCAAQWREQKGECAVCRAPTRPPMRTMDGNAFFGIPVVPSHVIRVLTASGSRTVSRTDAIQPGDVTFSIAANATFDEIAAAEAGARRARSIARRPLYINGRTRALESRARFTGVVDEGLVTPLESRIGNQVAYGVHYATVGEAEIARRASAAAFGLAPAPPERVAEAVATAERVVDRGERWVQRNRRSGAVFHVVRRPGATNLEYLSEHEIAQRLLTGDEPWRSMRRTADREVEFDPRDLQLEGHAVLERAGIRASVVDGRIVFELAE
jgi:hypothetical protein